MSCAFKLRLLPTLIVLSGATVNVNAIAGGLWIQDFGDPAMGRANAGAAAGVNDAATVLHNPAYMNQLAKEQLMVAGGLIYTDLEFDLKSVDDSLRGSQAGSKEGSNPGGLIAAASVFYANPLGDKWSWGVSFSASSGATTDHDNDWVGRFDLLEMELVIVGLAPALSYQVNEWLSVAGSLELVYSEVTLTLATPAAADQSIPESRIKLDGNDFLVSYSLSAAIKLSEQTRLGFRYHPGFTVEFDDLELKQPNSIDPANAITADLKYGQFVRLGLTHHWNNKLGLHATIGWDDWSHFDEVPVQVAGTSISVDENWNDTYHYALGLSYELSPQWLLSAGASYDSNPIDNNKRYAQLAVDRQIRVAFGAQYNYKQPLSIGTQLVIFDGGAAEIERAGWYYTGEFDQNRAYMWMVNANWLF